MWETKRDFELLEQLEQYDLENESPDDSLDPSEDEDYEEYESDDDSYEEEEEEEEEEY